MKGMIRDLRVCRAVPCDEDAQSNLVWRCALWGSRFFQLGRRFSFPALPVREAAILSASDWEEYAGALAVLLLSLCRRETQRRPAAMARLALSGTADLAAFLDELSLPAKPGQLDAVVLGRLERIPSAQNLLVYTA